MPIKRLNQRIAIMTVIALILAVIYLIINVDMENFGFAFSIRGKKLLGVVIAAACISSGTVIFQTMVGNRILTPCILGLTALYVLTQTVIVFILGATSFMITNRITNFGLSMGIMMLVSVFIYRTLFEKQRNMLLLLLIGSVMGSFFSSLTQFMQRIIDPNEFLTLQNRLFASFRNINTEILLISLVILFVIWFWIRKEIKTLDVMALGKEQAISLGIEYDSLTKKYMFIVCVLISIATSLVGPITFLGFLIANLTHETLRTYRHNYLLAGTFLIGCITLLFAQTLVEQVFEFNATLTSIINFVGGIYFIYLVMHSNKD